MTKIPSWGRVVAQPHEFLIQIRNGKVIRNGQGVSCFKWPGDSVTLIPTSIAKLSFRADQVTLEKAGVEVTGLAVYRIVEPMLAYRMVDQDRASMTDILKDMFVGATRRIVACLTLEECITHRKERVAEALMKEIAPVLAGEGTLSDTTAAGWGVVIDTIEIQDVKVLSQEVFARLQAPYREKLALEALLAKDNVSREEAKIEFERKRAEEQATLELMAQEEARLLAERRRQAEALEHKQALDRRAQEIEFDRKRAEEQARLELMTQEEARLLAERRRQAEALEHKQALERRTQEAELSRLRDRAEGERERAQIELATKRETGELEAELERIGRSAHTDLSEARLQEILLTETMPAIAEAFRGSFDRVNVTSGDGSNLFAFLSAGLDQVMEVAQKRRVALAPKGSK